MATIFLSYRRTDSPQACRVYDWLGQRFGYDSVFMDVAAIPFAVNFQDYIKQAIASSRILIVLVGPQWVARIQDEDDPVRMEIEAAIANKIPILPVLIGNTPMPDSEELPSSIATISSQNATTVGVLLDFNSHMQLLLLKIESILGALARTSVGHLDSHLIRRAGDVITGYMREKYGKSNIEAGFPTYVRWTVIGTRDLSDSQHGQATVTLFLHRVVRLAELVELHFILSFWDSAAAVEQALAGWVMLQLEQTPVVPNEFLRKFGPGGTMTEWGLKIRWSDEDPRQVWKMITDQPLKLSLAYVATVSPRHEPPAP